MKKYFTKEESNLILSLFNSKDIESIKLGISVIKTHPKYKNFKKCITYRNKFIETHDPDYSGYKNNVKQELQIVEEFFKYSFHSSYFLKNARFLIRFIKKRTK